MGVVKMDKDGENSEVRTAKCQILVMVEVGEVVCGKWRVVVVVSHGSCVKLIGHKLVLAS